MHQKTVRAMKQAILLCANALLAANAHSVTVDAGDYSRLPDGTNLAVVYYQHFEGKQLYSQGDKLSANARLAADVGILRGVRFIDVGDFTVVPQFLLPFGQLKTGGDLSGLSSTNGIGDLIFAPTIHLLKDPERKRAFAVTPWLYMPTGQYNHDKALNAFGENRWKLDMQVGYITPLSDKWTLDLVGDVVWYGQNNDFGSNSAKMKQSLSYQVQTHLRYHITPGTYVAGMLSYDWGGETTVNGIRQGDRQERTKALLSVGHFLTPTVQVLGSYGQDLSIRTGVKEDNRFNLRLVKVF